MKVDRDWEEIVINWTKANEELRAEVERLRALVKKLADDLEGELNARYPPGSRASYPSEQRRYEREMANVYEALAARLRYPMIGDAVYEPQLRLEAANTIDRLRADVDALSRTLNGLANRPDFADKVLEVRRKADKALELRRALEPKP